MLGMREYCQRNNAGGSRPQESKQGSTHILSLLHYGDTGAISTIIFLTAGKQHNKCPHVEKCDKGCVIYLGVVAETNIAAFQLFFSGACLGDVQPT